jgi:GntR family transcriptional regulator
MVDPMYRQIAEDLRRQIEAGDLPPGGQLRTEPELQKKYGASRNTVREAVKWLVTLGLVETRPGQGTFVVEETVPYVTTLSTDPKVGSSEGPVYQGGREVKPWATEPPTVEMQRAYGRVAFELRLDEGAEVISRNQQRYVGETPWSLQTSFYPRSLLERGALRLLDTANIEEGTVTYLEETLRIEQAGYRDTITVRAPNAMEAAFFHIAADGRVAILAAFRTAFDQDGNPIRITITVYPADRTLFRMNVGQVPPQAIGQRGGQDKPPADDLPDSVPARGG